MHELFQAPFCHASPHLALGSHFGDTDRCRLPGWLGKWWIYLLVSPKGALLTVIRRCLIK